MKHRTICLICCVNALFSSWLVFAQASQPLQRPRAADPADASLIEDLAAAYRILAAEGIVDAYGHVSVRHNRDPNRYLMARSLAPALVTSADIVEFDLDSRPVEGNTSTPVVERYIHGEIYKARPDVMAVVHFHSLSVIPFSVSSVPLRPVFTAAAFIGEGVPVFKSGDVEKVTNMVVENAARGKALAGVLADRSAVLLRRRGGCRALGQIGCGTEGLPRRERKGASAGDTPRRNGDLS